MQLGYLSHPPAGAHALSCPNTVWGSFCGCWAIYLALLLSGADLPKRKLKRKEQIEWHSRVVSSAHAILLCFGALLCYLELQDTPRKQLVSGYAVWPDVFARIFLGEFMAITAPASCLHPYAAVYGCMLGWRTLHQVTLVPASSG